MCEECDRKKAARQADYDKRIAVARSREHKAVLEGLRAVEELLYGYANTESMTPERLDKLEDERQRLMKRMQRGGKRPADECVLLFGALLHYTLSEIDQHLVSAADLADYLTSVRGEAKEEKGDGDGKEEEERAGERATSPSDNGNGHTRTGSSPMSGARRGDH